MFKNLKLLFSLRSWLKSKTLSVSGIISALLAADISTGNAWAMTAVEWLSTAIGVMSGTALALVLAGRELLAVFLRAKTERSLADK